MSSLHKNVPTFQEKCVFWFLAMLHVQAQTHTHTHRHLNAHSVGGGNKVLGGDQQMEQVEVLHCN